MKSKARKVLGGVFALVMILSLLGYQTTVGKNGIASINAEESGVATESAIVFADSETFGQDVLEVSEGEIEETEEETQQKELNATETDMVCEVVCEEENKTFASKVNSVMEEEEIVLKEQQMFHVTYVDPVFSMTVPQDAKEYEQGASFVILSMYPEIYTDTATGKVYRFAYWTTTPDGSGSHYEGYSSYYSIQSDVTFYANWVEEGGNNGNQGGNQGGNEDVENIVYTITYDANGGNGSYTDSAKYAPGSSVVLPEAGNISKKDICLQDGVWEMHLMDCSMLREIFIQIFSPIRCFMHSGK